MSGPLALHFFSNLDLLTQICVKLIDRFGPVLYSHCMFFLFVVHQTDYKSLHAQQQAALHWD